MKRVIVGVTFSVILSLAAFGMVQANEWMDVLDAEGRILGPRHVSIRTSGRLSEVTRELDEKHDIKLFRRSVFQDPNVTLDMDDATPKEIVREICKQASCGYEGPMGDARTFHAFRLVEGDPGADSRPHGTTGDIRLHVERVRMQKKSEATFSWSLPRPKTEKTAGIGLRISAQARDMEVWKRIFGLSSKVTALFDTGETYTTPREQSWTVQEFSGTRGASASLPLPKKPANSIENLKCTVVLHKRAEMPVFRFPMGETGTAKTEGSVTIRLADVSTGDNEIHVTAYYTHRGPLPTARSAILEGPHGERVDPSGLEGSMDAGKGWWKWRFKKPDWPVEAVLIGAYFPTEAKQYVSITIPDIPLPEWPE